MATGALLLAAWMSWRSRRRAFAVTALAGLALLAALIPWLQLAGGMITFAGDAALASLYLSGFALALIFGHHMVEEWGHEQALAGLAWLILVAGLASVWLALYQWQSLDYLGLYTAPLEPGARPWANLNQPNHLATLLVMGLVAVAGLYDARRLGAATAWALILLFGFGLAMTQSRTGLLEVLVAGAWMMGCRRALGRRLAARHLLIGIALVLGMPIVWDAANSLLGNIASRSGAAMLQPGTRPAHWLSMWGAILQHPWLGHGWNQTLAAQFAVAPDYPAIYQTLEYGHNIIVDLLVWNGLALGLVIAAALAWWFWAATRGTSDSYTALALAGVVAVFFHAMVEYPLYYAYFLLPIGLVMGVISAVTMPLASIKVPASVVALLLGTAGIALATVASDYFGLEEDVRSLRFEHARIGIDKPRHELSRPVLLTQVGAYTRFARSPERDGMSDAELRAMADVVRRYPSGANMVRFAAALALNERPEDATQVLRRVCKLESVFACEGMKTLWRGLGARLPAISRLAWPPD